jgi:hypothetical protein
MKFANIITRKSPDGFAIVGAFANLSDAFDRMDSIYSNVLQDIPAPLACTVELERADGRIRFIKHGSKQWHINCCELIGADQ